MMRKFAVALIATTMLVAPALAADAVKPTPAAPVAASTTAAPTATPAPQAKTTSATKTDIKTDKHLKTLEVAHHRTHHMTFAKNGKSVSHVKIAKVSKPATFVTTTPSTMMWFPWTATKTDQHLKTFKIAHHHAHHVTFAKNGKPVSHVKIAKVSKPVKAVTVAPAASSVTPAASSVSNPAVKIIKAKNLKKLKVVDRHNGNQLTVAKNSTHVNQVKTAKVSKPTKHANVGKGQVAHVVKSNKVIVN
jgi:hypothetical protein